MVWFTNNGAKLDQAIEEYKTALSIDENNAVANYNLGLAYNEKNDLDQNTGIGSFEYDISEREKYLGQLKSIGATVESDGSPQTLVLVKAGARWEIELPARSGVGKYRVEPAGE